ncbi:glycosyltransferase, SpsF domain-containing [Syntrophotalea carbinolica DSM 2380]|uniref:Glycosyltransferase, SpsF domain-containing n=1 Tax=Syntrophotalea carbinolica (strain DSM 2380 / NBRC 103641 / GraBd1) TaxID=338963 RepID=Q3A5H1_SYNC1|nr:NTP transferase domain-containing protein [Syntrophotalea carbinolica]ABA88386.1 glycosyltransferase, SpsF domain-containing [Syntrophotalea carbinolica DSM 2380]
MTESQNRTSKKVIAIIQARMGSSRLPGKMMEPIMGQPLMYHIIARALQIRCAQAVYLATTDQPIDDPLVELAQKMGLKVVRGSEDNVMQRFFLAIEDANADYIIRICGDAPLFDPEFMDQSTAAMVDREADCIRPICNGPSAYQGAGPISRRALEWSREVAPDDPRTYEHVTAYAYDHMDRLKTVPFDIAPAFQGEYKLSIDTPHDLEFFRNLYAHLYKPGQIISLEEAVQFIKKSKPAMAD